MLQIRKRNGILVPFDKQRIIDAINKAFIEVDGQLYEDDTAKDIADEVKYKVKTSNDIVSVEDVEYALLLPIDNSIALEEREVETDIVRKRSLP